MQQPPQKIGKYTIIERIGRGGMGYVYRAVDPLLKRDVALKTMLKDVSDDPDLRSRFMREAQSAGGLRHPNIVTIYDLGEDEQGCPFIAMEFLTGTDLEQIIKNKVDILLPKKLDIIIQTCMGLGYAHNNGIVHRDIKPANIRLLDNGEVKIMDFGIAKITASQFTKTGMVMGTPHYMAPEQIRGEKVDRRADIFSVGVVLYELLTYRKPFPGDNPTTVLFKIIHSEPEPLTDPQFVPPLGLDEIVQKALAKKPEDRYQDCEAVADDLLQVLNKVQMPDATMIPSPKTPLPFSIGRTPFPSQRRTPLPSGPATPRPSTEMEIPKTKVAGAATQTPPPVLAPQEPAAATVITPRPSMPPQTGPTMPAYKKEAAQPSATPQASPPFSPETRRLLVTGSIIFFVFALLLAVAVTAYKKLNQPRPEPPSVVTPINPGPNLPPKPEIKKNEPAPVPVLNGYVSLNIQPWAEIREVKDAAGKILSSKVLVTPCKLELPAGKYQITLANPDFKTMVLNIEVKDQETTIIKRKLEGFNYARAVDSLDL
jgi:eukaryotic-like serine/threonine-protein kinase